MPSHPGEKPPSGGHLVLVGALLLTLVAASFAAGIVRRNDLLSVLPEGDPEVATFLDIGATFNLTRAAIIGLEANDGDLFTVPRLAAIRGLARALETSPNVASVTAFTELTDASVAPGADGADQTIVQALVGDLPADPKVSVEDVRERVMSRPHLRGALVSNDGKATLVVVVPREGQEVAEVVGAEVGRALGGAGLTASYIGLPFVNTYVADLTAKDAKFVGPFFFLALLVAVLATTRSLSATGLALGVAVVSLVWTLGVFAAVGGALDTVTSLAPLLLLVLGVGIAVFSIEDARARGGSGGQKIDARQLRQSVCARGLPCLALAAAPAIGLLSSDVAPLRALGGLTLAGCLMLAVCLVFLLPAAVNHLSVMPRPQETPAIAASTSAFRAVVLPVAVGLVVVLLATSRPYSPFASALDPARPLHASLGALLGQGSTPGLGEAFLERRFGGALYLQVEVQGDVKHPLVLRQIERFADEVRPWFVDVRSVVDAFKVAAKGLTGEARVPASERTTAALAALLAAEPDLKALIADDFKKTILQLRLPLSRSDEAVTVAGRLQAAADRQLGSRVAVARESMSAAQKDLERREVAEHLSDLSGGEVTVEKLNVALSATSGPKDAARITERLRLDIEENELLYLAKDKTIDQLAAAIAERPETGGPSLATVVEAFVDPKELEDRTAFDDAVEDLQKNLDGVDRAAATQAIVAAVLALSPRLQAKRTESLAAAVSPLSDPYGSLPATALGASTQATALGLATPLMTATASARVTGHPLVLARQAVSLQTTSAAVFNAGLLAAALLGFALAGGALRRRLHVALSATLSAGAAFVAVPLALEVLGVGLDPAVLGGLALAMGLASATALIAATGRGERATAFPFALAPALLLFLASSLPSAGTFGLLTALSIVVGALVTRLLGLPASSHSEGIVQ